jgi:hypothetical protein
MEGLDKAHQRNQQRLSKDILKPVEVRTLSDIKRVVADFDPARNPQQASIPISARMEELVDGQRVVYRATADTKSKSKRDMLLEGLALIRDRQEADKNLKQAGEPIEVDGRLMKPATLSSNIEGHNWVDPLIGQWTGGIRKGTLITWDLGDGYEYRYDVFAHELSRVPRAS